MAVKCASIWASVRTLYTQAHTLSFLTTTELQILLQQSIVNLIKHTASRKKCRVLHCYNTHLNLGSSLDTVPTSISDGLKSAESTDDKQLTATCIHHTGITVTCTHPHIMQYITKCCLSMSTTIASVPQWFLRA